MINHYIYLPHKRSIEKFLSVFFYKILIFIKNLKFKIYYVNQIKIALNKLINRMNDDEHYEQTLEPEFQVALPLVREKQFVDVKTDNDEDSAQAVPHPQIFIVLPSSE